MANEKSTPKLKDNTVKSTPKSVDRNILKNTPKTVQTGKVVTAAATVQTVIKRSAAKQAIEIKDAANNPAEQSDRPENDAVDTIEEHGAATISAGISAVDNAKRYATKKYRQHQGEKNNVSQEQPASENSAQVLSEHNQPKTSEHNKPKTADDLPKTSQNEQTHLKTQKQAAVKTKENYTAANKKTVEAKTDIKVKTKDAYISAQTEKKLPKSEVAVKTKERYIRQKQSEIKIEKNTKVSEKATSIKTKENYIKQHTLEKKPNTETPKRTYKLSKRKLGNQTIQTKDISTLPIQPKTVEQARKEYVVKKVKTKAKTEKQIIKNDNKIKPTQSKTVSVETLVKSTPVEDMPKEPIGKHTIKTKENYINSIRTKPAEIVKTPYNNVPKQNTHTVTRSVQTSSKAVRVKEKTSKNTVKNSRNIFKSSRTAKRKTAKATKKAVKTQKQAAKAAKQAAKQAKELAKKSAQAAKAAAKAAVRVAVKVAQAVAAAAKALVSAIAAGGPVAVVIVILIVIIIVAAIVASPLGITISEEVTDAGTIPLSQIIAEYNVELTQETEDIELSVAHNTVEVIDNRTDNNIVIAVFAAKLAGAEDNTAEDVVVFDDVKAEKLKEFFRAANTVSYSKVETTVGTGEDATTEISLTITVTGKTKDELMNEYSLTERQREAVEMLLANGDILTSTSHSLAITDANVQAIINGLPASLPQKRKDVVKNAASLVGKVNYFWGGKSSAIGWDSAWGTMQRVTAAGSPSSGTIRSYGLDCSGYVTWAFNNSGMYVGDGTYGQRDRSVVVSASAVQAGDLCFLSSYSHVGIVVGKDASGNILVFHCSSSANNVVLSTASSVGFTVFRRPNCY